MSPRWLSPQMLIAVAVTLLLLAVLSQAAEARRWHKQSDRYQSLYLAEQKARAQTIANTRAAAEAARIQDLANAARVVAEQRLINERITHDLEIRLADARALALRLQLAQRQAAAAAGGARPTAVPALGATPGEPGRAAAQAGLSLAAENLSLEERLIATEQAIQLDELIKWVKAQAAINDEPGE